MMNVEQNWGHCTVLVAAAPLPPIYADIEKRTETATDNLPLFLGFGTFHSHCVSLSA